MKLLPLLRLDRSRRSQLRRLDALINGDLSIGELSISYTSFRDSITFLRNLSLLLKTNKILFYNEFQERTSRE